MTIGRFIGGIGALVWSPKDDKYLLLRRSADKDFASGIWECVTGRVEQGESFEDALFREVREELGVEVELEFMLGTTHFYRGAALPENELIGVVCLVSLDDPDSIQISSEHSQARWLSAAEIYALLETDHASARWIRGVIERAEALKEIASPPLRDYFRSRGMELG
jgi:8-oxo-dGTP diphosphatase